MGILLLYDVTDEASFNNIRNWMRNIEQHASDKVNKVRWASCCLRWNTDAHVASQGVLVVGHSVLHLG